MRYGFGQIEAALQKMQGVNQSKATAFRARLRYLQQKVDIGMPRAGGGRRANFEIQHAVLFAVAIELEQYGMTPEKIASAFNFQGMDKKMQKLRTAIANAAKNPGTGANAIILWFAPNSLSEATSDSQDGDLATVTFNWTRMSEVERMALVRMSLGSEPAFRRFAAFNLSAVVADVVALLAADTSIEACLAQLHDWATAEDLS